MACHMNAQGDLICPTAATTVPLSDTIWASVQSALSDLPAEQRGPARLALIRKLIEVVVASPLTDSCIGVRTPDAVGSLTTILASAPPVLLAYRYVALPGDVLASFYTGRGRWVEAHKVAERWSELDPSC